MNRKQLNLIIVLVLVLGALALWIRHQRVASFQTGGGRMGQKALGQFDVNSVARILIQKGTNQLHLVKKEGRWTVQERGGYPAAFSEIRGFLRSLYELKIVQPIQASEAALARLDLAPPEKGTNAAAVRVELGDKEGKTVKSILLGKQHMRKPTSPSPYGGDEGWPDGRYILVPGKQPLAGLVSKTFSNIEPKPEQWLDKEWFKAQKIRSIQVDWPNPADSWKASRKTETDSFQLADAKSGEALDTTKAASLGSAFSYPTFTDVAVDAKPDQTGLDKPVVIRIETFDDFTYTIRVGKKTSDDKYYMTVDVDAKIPEKRTPGKDEKKEDKEKLDKQFEEKVRTLKEKLKKEKAFSGWVYLVSKWTVDSVLKKRSELLKKPEAKKPETKESETKKPAAKEPEAKKQNEKKTGATPAGGAAQTKPAPAVSASKPAPKQAASRPSGETNAPAAKPAPKPKQPETAAPKPSAKAAPSSDAAKAPPAAAHTSAATNKLPPMPPAPPKPPVSHSEPASKPAATKASTPTNAPAAKPAGATNAPTAEK